MSRVTVVGHPGLDTLILLDRDDLDLCADGYFTRNVDTPGGAPTYTARGMARLGHDTRLLGALGDDVAGRTVRTALEVDGVDCATVFEDPAGTTRSANLVFPGGRRLFFFDGGSHTTLVPSSALVSAALAGADLVFSALADWARHVVVAARSAGILVAVDLQDVRDPADPYRADFVAAADHIFASAAHLSDPVAAARRWMAHGPARTVVFGMGDRGALLVSRPAQPGGEPVVVRQPPAQVDRPVVDTTGAGDALACGFLDGLLRGMPLTAALARGQVSARVTAGQVGGDALATAAELAALSG